jgi:hypothetical protein
MPAWTYWEAIELPLIVPQLASAEPPLSVGRLTRVMGMEPRWAAASDELRDAVLARGFAVARSIHPTAHLGDFYAGLRDERVPSVITLDVLFFLAHIALDRALADVDAYVLAPSMATMLHRMDVRLAAEGRSAGPDLVAPYVVARGVVAVALALAEPTYTAAPDIAPMVAREKARVLAHAAIGVSPWLGTAIDYTAMSARGMAGRNEWRAGWFRALSWLQNASLALEGAGERNAHVRVDIATARVHACAALLLARLIDEGVDAEAANAWERIERESELVVGDTDDVTARDLAAASARADLDLRKGDWLANVVRVDRVRHAVARGRVAASFRLLGLRSTPDTELLQSLSFPSVGPRKSPDPSTLLAVPGHPEPPPTARAGMRAIPSALDVAAWLGSGGARAALHDSGDDAYERYDEILDRAMRSRPSDSSLASPGRHRTPYLSWIDAIETWLMPSAGDAALPGASTSELRKRKAKVAMAAWTELRHDAMGLIRIPLAEFRLPSRAAEQGTVPVLVEPHPEAIAKLAGSVRQVARALIAEHALPSGAPARGILDEVDDLLWTALGAAVYETSDEPLPPLLEAALSTFPARIQALEAALAETGAADVPLVVDVHVDVASARVLEEAIGSIDEAWMLVREPGTHRLWIALGASIQQHEFVQPASQRLSDGAWRTHLQTTGDPPRDPLARSYVIGP